MNHQETPGSEAMPMIYLRPGNPFHHLHSHVNDSLRSHEIIGNSRVLKLELSRNAREWAGRHEWP
jgi:hypothetical protein